MAPKIVRYGSTVNLSSFDVLAFDLDQTVARYNNPNLMKLIYECVKEAMISQSGYDPASMRLPFDLATIQKGVILDFHTGDALKLDAEGKIAIAFHGHTRLHAKEIAKKYGEARAWPGIKLLRDFKRHDSFFVLLTYFDAPCMGLFMQLVEYMDAHPEKVRPAPAVESPVSPAPSTAASLPSDLPMEALLAAGTLSYDDAPIPPKYIQLKRDLVASFDYIFDNVPAFISGRGGFFSALRADPAKYVFRRDALKETLMKIRKTAKHRLVLVTNSHINFALLTLNASFGDDWQNCFDMVVFNSLKPRFFSHDSPWFSVDWEAGKEGPVCTRTTLTLSPTELTDATRAATAVQTGAKSFQHIFDVEKEIRLARAAEHPHAAKGLQSVCLDIDLNELGQVTRCEPQSSGSHETVVTSHLHHSHEGRPHTHHSAQTRNLIDALATPQGATPGLDAEHVLRRQTSHERTKKGRSEVIYFGDHINGDVIPAVVHAEWSAVAVVEELECSQPGAGALRDGGGIEHIETEGWAPANFGEEYHASCIWGDFFYATPEDRTTRSYYCDVLAKYSVLAVSDLEPSLAILVADE